MNITGHHDEDCNSIYHGQRSNDTDHDNDTDDDCNDGGVGDDVTTNNDINSNWKLTMSYALF